jgi:uncharacterized damage-inducible protein DinB
MTKAYFLQLAEYNIWANTIVIGWVEKITEEQWNREMVGSMKSIGATCVHIAGAEKVWNERLAGEVAPFLSTTFNGTREELITIWKKASADLLNYIKNCATENLQNSFDYKNIKGESFTSKIYEVLAHVCNHSTYHRGQVVNYLRQVGFTDVSSTDLIQFFRGA